MIVKGDNSYSDLTDQELNNPHIQYVERPMMAPLEPWMAAANAPPPSANSQQQHYYNANENGSFLPTPPGSSHPRQSHQLQQLPQQQQQQQNSFANHEFMSNSSSNVPVNYQHSHQHHRHQVYSPSPSPPRYRQGSVASDSSNPSSTPYGELDEHSSQSSRNHAGGGGGGGTKMTVNKRDKALERNRQGKFHKFHFEKLKLTFIYSCPEM